MEEFDAKKYERTIRDEGREESLGLVTQIYNALETYDAENEWEKIAELVRK